MDQVFLKTQELGQALLESDAYKQMKAAEEKVTANELATRLVSGLMECRAEIARQMQSGDPDPMALKRLSDEMDGYQEQLDLIDDVVALTQARNGFNQLMEQINQVLSFIVTGRMEQECGGDCGSCSGCH